jgi:CBS-domain-containing membrane protein
MTKLIPPSIAVVLSTALAGPATDLSHVARAVAPVTSKSAFS